MSDLFTTYADLAAEIDIQKDGTISKTLYQDDSLKIVLFGFDAGQELSEHTAAVPAMLQFLDGDATVTLGDKTIDAAANTFVHMAAKLPHSISANEPTRMLLLDGVGLVVWRFGLVRFVKSGASPQTAKMLGTWLLGIDVLVESVRSIFLAIESVP